MKCTKDGEPTTAVKRKVFKVIFSQFKEAWAELNHFFEASSIDDIYQEPYLKNIKLNQLLNKRKIDLKEFAQIDIIYLIVFFGLSREDKTTILNVCQNKYKRDFVINILDYSSLKPKRESNFWVKWETIMQLSERNIVFDDIINIRKDKLYKPKKEVNFIQDDEGWFPFEPFYPDNYNKYYGGHQFRLGHYYRHLFQTVKFIDNEKYLSESEKYNYIKILRGQLSNYEQLAFFLNSISEIGRTWELMRKNKPDKEVKRVKRLITKYHLIKNIPIRSIVGEIDLLDYYPDINYESIN